MKAEIEGAVKEDVDMDFSIPCDGLNTVRPDGTPVARFSCDNPATWRWTVYCCGTRSSFSCTGHKKYDDLSGTQCIHCNALPIEISWQRL